MANRKKEAADRRKLQKANSTRTTAEKNHTPTSPRKMRLVADLVRGKKVAQARVILSTSTKHAARTMLQTLNSAVSNYLSRNEERNPDEANLYVTEILVDQGVTMKRMLPAPMGRAYRMRKRSNHLTITVDEKRAN
jgi:large subunit ribosomal protein L22